MSKIKNDLREIHKIVQIFPDVSMNEIKPANLIIFQSKSAQVLKKISCNIDKLATAKQSQIISTWWKQRTSKNHKRTASRGYKTVSQQVVTAYCVCL